MESLSYTKTLQNARRAYVTFAAINASLTFFSYFYGICIFNSLNEALQRYVFPDSSIPEFSLFASITFFGGTLGALAAGKLGNRFGRRFTLIVANLISIIGVILSLMPHMSFFLIGRALVGFNGGISLVLVNIYISEISEDPLRGQIGVIPNIAATLGMFVAFAAGGLMPYFVEHGIPEDGSRFLLIAPAVANAIEIINLLFLFNFETPIYLVAQEKESEAKEVLKLLYQSHHTLKLSELIKEKDLSYHVPLRELLLPAGKFWRPFVSSIALCLTPSLMGGIVPLLFSNTFFSEGMDTSYTTLPLILTGLLGISAILSSLLALLLIKHFGRRTLAVISFCLLTLVNLVATIIMKIDLPASTPGKVLIFIWMIIFSSSLQPLGFLYPSEVLPEAGVTMIMTIGSASAFIITQVFMPLSSSIGYFGLYLIFTCFSVIGLAVILVCLTETKNKPRLDILHGIYNELVEGEESPLDIAKLD